MSAIRPFVKEDIPQVAELHERVMRDVDRPASQEKQSYWEKIFFHNPWYDEELPSLVYESRQGNIVGFLGVIVPLYAFWPRKR